MANNKNIALLLHNIRSRFNVGAIFRTADAAGISKIYLCGITPVPPHPKIDKVALGAEQTVPFEQCRQTGTAIRKLKRQGYYVVALEQSTRSIPYYRLKSKKPMALVLGNEVAGLPLPILKKCDRIIEIPMYGQKESLNVAIATGIVIFDIINK